MTSRTGWGDASRPSIFQPHFCRYFPHGELQTPECIRHDAVFTLPVTVCSHEASFTEYGTLRAITELVKWGATQKYHVHLGEVRARGSNIYRPWTFPSSKFPASEVLGLAAPHLRDPSLGASARLPALAGHNPL